MPRSYLPRETDEQRVVVDWCRLMGIGIFSIPNGVKVAGPWRYAQVARQKQCGMLPGAPDLVLIDLSPLTRQPVAIEMKRKRRGVVTDAQRSVHALMRASGWHVIVARGASDAIEKLRALGYADRIGRGGAYATVDALSASRRRTGATA